MRGAAAEQGALPRLSGAAGQRPARPRVCDRTAPPSRPVRILEDEDERALGLKAVTLHGLLPHYRLCVFSSCV